MPNLWAVLEGHVSENKLKVAKQQHDKYMVLLFEESVAVVFKTMNADVLKIEVIARQALSGVRNDQVEEFLARANWGLQMGYFSNDHSLADESDSLAFIYSCDYENVDTADVRGMFDISVATAMSTLQRYVAGARLMQNGKSAREAITQVES